MAKWLSNNYKSSTSPHILLIQMSWPTLNIEQFKNKLIGEINTNIIIDLRSNTDIEISSWKFGLFLLNLFINNQLKVINNYDWLIESTSLINYILFVITLYW